MGPFIKSFTVLDRFCQKQLQGYSFLSFHPAATGMFELPDIKIVHAQG